MTGTTQTRMSTRKRIGVGVAIAIVALLALGTTAFAAGPGGMRGNKAGHGGMDGNGFGLSAVVTAADAGSQTITLGGLPQQIATVKVTSDVKLVAIQPDGTKKDVAFGDFKVGSLVEISMKRGGKGSTSGTQGQPNVAISELRLVPAGQVMTEGLVVNTGSTLQIIGHGGLKLNVQTSGSPKVTKGQNDAAASVGDIKVGDRIAVHGTQSGDTVTATTIRIFDLSALQRGGMRPGAAPSATPKP